MTMKGCGLEKIDHFPRLEKLSILELSDNSLKGESLKVVAERCPALYKLKIEDNKIEKVEDLEALKEIKSLEKLSVSQNPLSSAENYRDKIFHLLPNLKSIDGLDREGNDVESTIYEGGDEEDEEYESEKDEEEYKEEEDEDYEGKDEEEEEEDEGSKE